MERAADRYHINSMNSSRYPVCLALLLLSVGAIAQEPCPEGTLYEPYTAVCAEVRDLRDDYPLSEVTVVGKPDTELPVPGSMAVGTAYSPNQLVALDSGRLHTKMFVYPNGVSPSGPLPLFYTTATSRVSRGLELLVAYSDARPDISRLNLYAWPCLPDYPCPDGDTSPGWQWARNLTELTCNITQIVDQGGHAQKQLYYANHTDRLDDGSPPQWKSAIYIWNYCDAAWDLAWQHTYRQDKVDCSIPGAGCAWWGPSFEIFGNDPYPQIAELGYEDSLLYHDGVWSELRPDEAGFRDPSTWAPTTPWQLFHLDPNRSYGVGNFLNENDPPEILDQVLLVVEEDDTLELSVEMLTVDDPDVDSAYHFAPVMTVHNGANYSHSDLVISPEENFNGLLTVPVMVSDGAADSPVFDVRIEVTPVNDLPVIDGHRPLSTWERSPIEIVLNDLSVTDADHDQADLVLTVVDGADYARQGNIITPLPGVLGDIVVPVSVTDPAGGAALLDVIVNVMADTIAPSITPVGPASLTINVNTVYTDAGATASDNVDGDLTRDIETTGAVNTAVTGVYTITYSVTDVAGNFATASRVITVRAPPQVSSSGGGATSPALLAALALLLALRICRRR